MSITRGTSKKRQHLFQDIICTIRGLQEGCIRSSTHELAEVTNLSQFVHR